MDNIFENFLEAQQMFEEPTAARQRLEALFDAGSFVELDAFARVDGKGTGVLTGYGMVGGSLVYAFSQDSTQLGGAMGVVHGGKIKKVYELACKTGAPVVGIYDSVGLRLEDGNSALAAYGELLAASNNLSGVVPQISVVLGVCAGVAALMATGGDFVVMQEAAQLFVTPPFTAKAQGEEVPLAGTAQGAAQAGVAHLVLPTEEEALEKVRHLVALLPANNLAVTPMMEFAAPYNAQVLYNMCFEGEIVPMEAILAEVVDDESLFVLSKGFGKNVLTALVTMGGIPCGIIGTQGAALAPDDCAKMARFVSICDSFHIPVITFVNTVGFEASAAHEIAGSIREMARLAHVYAEATTPKIAVIIGEAYGAAYLAMAGKGANADVVYAWPCSVISPLHPRTAVAFLEGEKITNDVSREQVEQEYRQTTASPYSAAAGGFIEDVIHPQSTRTTLLSALEMLRNKRMNTLPKKHGNMPM